MRTHVESSFEQFATVYSKPAVAESFANLFEKFGLGDTSASFFDVGRYEYVEPQNGVLAVDTNLLMGKTLVTAVESGSSVIVRCDQEEPYVYGSNRNSVTATTSLLGPDNPLIIFERHPDDGDRLINPGTIAHEMTHAAQYCLRPPLAVTTTDTERLQQAYQLLEMELQAYAVQDDIWDHCLELDVAYTYNSVSSLVSILQRKHQPEGYKASVEFAKLLAADEIVRVIVPEAIRSLKS